MRAFITPIDGPPEAIYIANNSGVGALAWYMQLPGKPVHSYSTFSYSRLLEWNAPYELTVLDYIEVIGKARTLAVQSPGYPRPQGEDWTNLMEIIEQLEAHLCATST